MFLRKTIRAFCRPETLLRLALVPAAVGSILPDARAGEPTGLDRVVYLYPAYLTNWNGTFSYIPAWPADSLDDRHNQLGQIEGKEKARSYINLAVNYWRAGRSSNALSCARAAAELDNSIRTEALTAQAVAMEQAGRVQEAIRTWWELDALMRTNAIPAYQVARCQLKDQRPNLAKLAVSTARDMRMASTVSHLVGCILLMEGNVSGAWGHFARAATDAEAWPESNIMLAQTAVLQGDLEEALGWLRKACQDTADGPCRDWLALPLFEPLKRFDGTDWLPRVSGEEVASRKEKTRKGPLCFEIAGSDRVGLPQELKNIFLRKPE